MKVVTRAHVTSIDVDEQGRVTGVTYRDRRRGVLPAGEGRSAGQPHLRKHQAPAAVEIQGVPPTVCPTITGRSAGTTSATIRAAGVSALFPFDLEEPWYGLPAQGVAVDDFADDNFDHSGLDFIGGGNLWVMSDRRPIAAAGGKHFWNRAPTWGSQSKPWIKRNVDRSHGVVLPEDDAAVPRTTT